MTKQKNPTRIDAGKLPHRIQIQSQSSTPLPSGQRAQTWTTIRTTWASFNVVTLKELFQPSQFTSQVTDIITIRYPNGITVKPGMRVLFEGTAYKIQAIDNVQQQDIVLRLLCLETNGPE